MNDDAPELHQDPTAQRAPGFSRLRAAAGRAARLVAYVVRDGLSSVRRTPGLALATALTIALACAMATTAAVTRAGVSESVGRWSGGVEFVVYLKPAATDRDVARVRATLERDRRVESVTYTDQAAARDQFARLYRGQGEVVSQVSADLLPSSFSVKPVRADERVVRAVAGPLRDDPAVYQVVTADDTIREVRTLSATAIAMTGWTAVLLGLVGAALCAAMIRTAVQQRSGELEVMWLVGASRSYVAGPLVVETMMCALAGVVVAAGAVLVGSGRLRTAGSPLMAALVPHAATATLVPVALVGAASLLVCCVTSAAACALALRRRQ